jgi:hypothetical protein
VDDKKFNGEHSAEVIVLEDNKVIASSRQESLTE